ncbi:MAG: twin-arginine translocation signal domain-containing protein [Rhodospirillales bacterium]|nr:twin-arginine translocation signal domain-containing protein [Rhodospirillales bacterium]
MTDKKKAKILPRREFLKTAGLTAGAAGIAVAAVSGSSAQASSVGESNQKSSGYRETEHVRTYYKTARF